MIEVNQASASIVTAEDIPSVLEAALQLAADDWYGGSDERAAFQEVLGVTEPKKAAPPSPDGSLAADYLAQFFAGYEELWGLNRDINQYRVDSFLRDMLAGRWWFTPDPIVVSTRGRILNGQHRIRAAIECLFRVKGGEALWAELPRFVLVTGVEERAALLMDEARRTANDRRTIAMRFAGA